MKLKKLNLNQFIKKMMHSLFEDILLKEITKYRDKKILVAFSGGKDSLALLNFINNNKDYLNIIVGACYINHGLRESAVLDEDFCEKYCSSNCIPFFSRNISSELKLDKNGGVEASARKYRYISLLDVLQNEGFDYIFTAHTHSDNIENFFIDLYTGSSIYTIGGIMGENNKIIRPMLEITTEMVNTYIKYNNLSPVFDETNDDIRYVRNKIRHKLIPLLYELGCEFEKTVKRLQYESHNLNNYFTIKTRHVILNTGSITVFNKNAFLLLENMEKEFLLGKAFSSYFRVTKNVIYETLLFFSKNSSKRLDLPNGYMVEQSFEEIKIFHKSLVEDFEYFKESGTEMINTPGFNIEFSGNFINKNLIIRNRKSGDRINNKKIKDIFINKHIELFDRDRAVIVLENDKIICAEYILLNRFIKIYRKRFNNG